MMIYQHFRKKKSLKINILEIERLKGVMLKRKITKQLWDWKNAKKKKCLLVLGARQVGKTYAVQNFGKTAYKEMLSINFKERETDRSIFEVDLSVDSMLTALRFRYPNMKFIPGQTLIFLDEIQECPEAITSLKFWTIDGRFDLIASGSLLGIDYKRASSYPVGYVEYLRMFGLDFEEFLWAKGVEEDLILKLYDLFCEQIPVSDAIHSAMMSYLREYLALGGMPEVLSTYLEQRDYRMADRIQRELLRGYLYDIAHYAKSEEKVKAEKCYLSLSKQLLDKENHKFQYKEVEKGGRAQKYFPSIDWLSTADMVSLAYLTRDVQYELSDYIREDFFRAYTTDLSLLLAMKDFSLKQHIVENTLIQNTKGGLYECLLADILIKKELPLYFYKNEVTKKEIDFLTEKEGKIIAIEVKSGKGKAKSLEWLLARKSIEQAYKFHDGNIGKENGVLSLPLYMAMFL